MYGVKNLKKDELLKDLKDELGNLLFTIMCFVNAEGISLSETHEVRLNKLYGRDNDRIKKWVSFLTISLKYDNSSNKKMTLKHLA